MTIHIRVACDRVRASIKHNVRQDDPLARRGYGEWFERRRTKLKDGMPKELKLVSHDLLVGPDRAPARAMLKAVGFTDEDLSRPIIGVANTWIEVMPCNFHLRRLSER